MACVASAGGDGFAVEPVQLATVFSDNMVLQRGKPIVFWGSGEPGTTIRVQFSGQSRSVVVDPAKNWKADFPELQAGGPYSATVTDAAGKVLPLSNIMVGDVWVVSGQSNMYWRLGNTDPVERANGVNSATLPGVRFFQIQRNDDPSRTRTDLAYDFGQSWSVCSPQTAAGYSAVAFYAAQRLHSGLSDVPIGIIDASWPGTAIQSWMTPESIDANQDIRRADAASSLPLISTWDRTPEAAGGDPPGESHPGQVLWPAIT